MKLCECGCGQEVIQGTKGSSRYYNKRFLKGHKRPHIRFDPIKEDIPSGICECGCGQPTPLATYTWKARRHFKGFPIPYLRGHSPKKLGADSHKWNGGHYQHRGWWYKYCPEHPNANADGYIFEHRLIMEEIIGRYLTKDETVHHINGNRSDNRPENLQLLTRSEHQAIHGRANKGKRKQKPSYNRL